MWKYNCEKRNKYYDEVIRLYTQEGLGSTKISRIIPVGRRIWSIHHARRELFLLPYIKAFHQLLC